MNSTELIAWLGKEAGLKCAEHFVLPPRKVTPKSSLTRVRDKDHDFDAQGGPSQLPHRYGVTRRPPRGS